jgi:hypothetical protein
MGSKIVTPFTPEQVMNLVNWQIKHHPFTCENRDDGAHLTGGLLIPTVRGWVCPFCDYQQDWAHDYMLRRN